MNNQEKIIEQNRRRNKWSAPPVAIILAIVLIQLIRDNNWEGIVVWGLLFVVFVLAIMYPQLYGSIPKRLILTALMVLLLFAATSCSAHYTSDPGPSIPPQVVGIHWSFTPNDGTQCGLELLADGTTALVGYFDPIAGVGVAWLAWASGVSQGPPGYSLYDCYEMAQQNWYSISLYTHCYGQPTIRTAWTDYHAMMQWVSIPMCTCNLSCQYFSGQINNWFHKGSGWCQFNMLDPRCSGQNSGFAPATADTITNPPVGQFGEQPLPSNWSSPGWDTTAPIPPAPTYTWPIQPS